MKIRGTKTGKIAGWICVALFAAALVTAFFLGSYSLVFEQIKSLTIENLEEMTLHDEKAVEGNISSEYELLEGIAANIRQTKCETTQELLLKLSNCKLIIDCNRLTLVSTTGKTISSNLVIEDNEELLTLCRETEAEFVFWLQGDEADADGKKEVLYFGVEISPFTVEGESYWYLVAQMDIDMLQKNLKVESFDEGYGNIIDKEGNYIVNHNRNSDIDNFYDKMSESTLESGWTIERIQEKIAANEKFSLECTDLDGTDYMRVFMPMERENWYFVTVIPSSVIQSQSLRLMMIFFCFWIALVVVMLIAVVIVLKRRSDRLKQEEQHHRELSEALALAKQSNRAKTTFLNNMSHDIRTPMNAIIGYTTLAATHIGDEEKVRDYLGKISQSSSHLLSLINDVLDMSRIEAGRMEIDEKPENLAEILHTLRNIVQADIYSKQLNFYIDIMDVSDEEIYCDKLRLNQILINIISNAIKFNRPGGSISLLVTQKSISESGYGVYEFRIRDTGIGISKEYLRDIFEPFTRERNSTVSGIQGTGLGMAITKNIIDLMGGTVEVSSEKGQGSEFVVTLEFKLLKEHRKIEPIKSLEGMRGLVVDDDINSCQSVSHMLLQIGMRSEWSMYGKEAVVRAKEALTLGDPFRVYIIDWLMPDMNGIEVARRIRREAGENVPIVILTAYDWADIEKEALEAGVTKIIGKPLFLSDLQRTLLKICKEEETEEAEQEPEPEETPNFDGCHILLAEDNLWNQEVAVELLTNYGLTVEVAENGAKAVDAVKTAPAGWFDLVLMDIQMPVMNGYEATKAIRALPEKEKANIPIVAMTADAFEEDRQHALEAGMNDHMSKPVDIEILMETLQRYVKK